MNPRRQNRLGTCAVMLAAGMLAVGCVSSSEARLREKNAFLAGQNTILLQQQAQAQNAAQAQAAAPAAAQSQGVMVIGAVQNPQVPWVTGLTLAQAIATAKYTGQDAPKQIIITRNGQSATMDPSVLLNGSDIPLEPGDVVELR